MEYDVNKQQENKLPHVCGQCEMGFATDTEYVAHTCIKTGHTPADIEHAIAVDPNYAKISEAALTRGNRRKELEAEGKTPEEAATIAHQEYQESLKAPKQ